MTYEEINFAITGRVILDRCKSTRSVRKQDIAVTIESYCSDATRELARLRDLANGKASS